MTKKKVCLFVNALAVYRRVIYKMLDEEYDCEWYVEDHETGVKSFDTSELRHVHFLPVNQFGSFYFVKGLNSLLKKDFDYYLFLGATRNISLFVFCLIKRLFYKNKRIFFWTHGYYGKERSLELLLWKRPLFKLADGLFVYGDYSKALMVKDGFDPKRVFPIHNSLAYDEQLLLRKEMTPSQVFSDYFGNNNPILIMIGRLNLRKHLDMLFYAVSELKKRGELYNIVLIGDGDDRKKLEDIASNCGLNDSTWFYGACYDERTNATLLFNADMCVVPGDIGLTAIHSLMFGVPVITHNCFKYQGPEFESVKPGITGGFYDYNNIDSLATTISDWFHNYQNKKDLVRKNCYEEIDNFWNPYYQIDVFRKYMI